MNETLVHEIENLMKRNRRLTDGHTYTVPSPELYPFQWLWDSCFHAVILSYFDVTTAWKELRSAMSKPLAGGLLPHIIYWKKDYLKTNWGREMRGDIISESWGVRGTSAITQPPLLASAIWDIHTRHENTSFLRETYPYVRAYYISLLTERDPGSRGLVGIINPDESGEDNSPRFDAAQGLAVNHTNQENLDKRIERIRQNRECGYSANQCMRDHFWIEDVSFNAILLVSLKALEHIAEVTGEKSDAVLFHKHRTQLNQAMREYMLKDGLYYSLEGSEHRPITIKTWGLFMPLYAELLSQEDARLLIENHFLNRHEFSSAFPIPSVSLDEDSYTQDNFWRGPTWMVVNWFIYKGLIHYGFSDLAKELREKSIGLVSQSGFREYYNPETGEGLGSNDFTWGGLIIDMT